MNAVEQVNRIVTTIAELSRRERAGEPMPSVTELAGRVGATPSQVQADLRVLQALNESAEADWFLSLRAYQTEDEIMISSGGPFRRPVRLTPQEALAMAVGLATEPAGTVPDAARGLVAPHELDPDVPVALEVTNGDLHRIHDAILDAIAGAGCLEIEYAGEGDDGVTTRVVQPHHLLTARGRSILIAWCEGRDGWRRFRTDRILGITDAGRAFAPRDDAPETLFEVPEDGVDHVTVRFDAGIARWLIERYPDATVNEDGTLSVIYACANPDWLVREVLQYGDAAEIVSPPSYRALIRRALTG